MKKFLALVLFVISGVAQATLVDRGGGFIYDDVLDITWTQNANLRGAEGPYGNGSDSWANQVAWADSLSLYDSVRGVTWDDWRLPTTPRYDPTCTVYNLGQTLGHNCAGSEMGHLFEVDGVSWDYPFLFANVMGGAYWSGTQFINETNSPAFDNGALQYLFTTGTTQVNYMNNRGFAWAVRDGDVAASVVPIPAAVWLFGSGLGLLGWFRRKQTA